MSKTPPFKLTREKHLDHMVKVIPFIVLMFGVQGYVLSKIQGGVPGGTIFFLAGVLIFMIGSFITYDVKHQVTFHEDHLVMKFLGIQKTVYYSEIQKIWISEANQNFASLQITTKSSRHTWFFVDNADEIKAFLEAPKVSEKLAA